MNWKRIIKSVPFDVIEDFADGNLSYNNFYKEAVVCGVGPEVRKLKVRGARSARLGAKAALRNTKATT